MPKTRGFDKDGKALPSILDKIDEKLASGRKMNKAEREVYDLIQNTSCVCEVNERSVTFRFSCVPKSLNERDKGHWFKNEISKQTWLGFMRKAKRSLLDQGWTQHQVEKFFPLPCPVVVELHTYRIGRIDCDNNSNAIKVPQDALVSAGVLPEDNSECIVDYRPYPAVKVAHREQIHMEIIVTPVNDLYTPKPAVTGTECLRFDTKAKAFV